MIPEAIVSVQIVYAGRSPPPEVKVNLDCAVPESDGDTVNVVVPHPLSIGADTDANEKKGNTSTI